MAQARDQGFRVEVHAIGDRALSAVLDAFEEAGITAADRPIVTHCQVWGRIYIYIYAPPKQDFPGSIPEKKCCLGKSWMAVAGGERRDRLFLGVLIDGKSS